tara:strand:- start:29 stop:712 length:684 start_codon:yes stop_codon:yes gene_type:complete
MNSYIDMSATDRARPKFQLAEKMRVPFGVRDANMSGMETNNPRKNMELSVDDASVAKFFQKLDTQNIDVATANSEKWFKKKLSRDAVEQMYRTSCSPDPNGKYAPLLRVKVGTAAAHMPTRIFVARATGTGGKMKYTPGTIDDVTPFSHVTPIVSIGGMWFMSKGFGMSLTCTDLLVYPSDQDESQAFPFVIGDDDDMGAIDMMPDVDDVGSGEDGKSSTPFDDVAV